MERGLKVLIAEYLRPSQGLLTVGLIVWASVQPTHATMLNVANNNTDVHGALENVIRLL